MSHQQPAQTTNHDNHTTRKKRRGMIEKRRRDKINHSLVELRRLVPAAHDKQGSAKLEKAEILQMTVDYLKTLHARGLIDCQPSPQPTITTSSPLPIPNNQQLQNHKQEALQAASPIQAHIPVHSLSPIQTMPAIAQQHQAQQPAHPQVQGHTHPVQQQEQFFVNHHYAAANNYNYPHARYDNCFQYNY